MTEVLEPAALDAPSDLGDVAIVARLGAYLTQELRTSVRVEGFRRFTGGLSWITAAFALHTGRGDALDARDFIVKIGSPAGLMAPYSSRPQSVVLRALAGTAVPVPVMRWDSDDARILGAPFLITDRVEGIELNPFTRDYGIADAGVLAPVGEHLAQVLGDLQRVDWRARGLSTLQGEDPRAPAGREQVRFWRERVRQWSPKPYPLMDYAAAWLVRRTPMQARTVIVHGDYRVGNFLADGGRIRAMLDWEMTHLGDPHEDLAWAMLPDMRLRGLLEHSAFIARYEAASGLTVDPDALAYYRVFSLYKMVAINLGGQSSFLAGGQDLRLVCLSNNIPMFMSRLAQALEGGV
ncbi:phosphotransferase family protein [Hydrogenophaga palleronii]|uniref:phosphotransferase family protein n=1 Tax=Hydrogenophaga palleronii TaxID=65655 RepID=UPI000826DB78|nr:phosphotransferase family protein [Hydrogenophaga palleronii]